MPNHVHLLIRVQDVPVWQLVDAWKGFTAKEANRILGRSKVGWRINRGLSRTVRRLAMLRPRTGALRLVKLAPMGRCHGLV